VTIIRVPRHRVPFCPGCGLYPHTHNWTHRPDCTAQQISERQGLINIAEVFGPHLAPQSAAELQQQITLTPTEKERVNEPHPPQR
jgi:hypothetical protein